jgi:uncharacterized membrane protein YkoI
MKRCLTLIGGVGLLVGCGRDRSETLADTGAMMPATSASTIFEVREASPGLLAEATFRPADAQRVVLVRFPDATITEATIDRSGSDLVYTYYVRDTSGQIQMVRVNARTGLVIEAVASGPGGRRGTSPASSPASLVIQVQEEVPGLLAQAQYHPLDAQHVAQAKYPTGKVTEGWLERRGGDLVYRFRIRDDNGVNDVLVDSFNGKIINSIPVKEPQ